ncbi:AMP-binding enzyme [Rhodococcus tibetensis]
MLGYYNDDVATEAARIGEWFKTGDLGVIHPDGSVEIRDRARDIVISGGENIATVEVEHVLTSQPAVAEAAVIGVADAKWGEVPVAVVTATARRGRVHRRTHCLHTDPTRGIQDPQTRVLP